MTRHSKDRLTDILDVAKEHFLQHGFKDASLRAIAREVGVTTGAIYVYFKNKEEVFEALVKETADDFFAINASLEETFSTLPVKEKINIFEGFYQDTTVPVFNQLYEQRDVFRLLFTRSKGTKYELYFDKWVEMEVKSNVNFLGSIKDHVEFEMAFDERSMHVIQKLYFKGIVDVLDMDIPLEEAKLCIENLVKYNNAGWRALLNI